jgi:hypothetical protein
MTPRLAAVISIALVAAALEPVLRHPDDDGFPLSTFPMFAAARPSQLAMTYAQGVTSDGDVRTLTPAHIGTGEVMQAYAMLQIAASRGTRARAALCEAIAARVARDDAYRDVVAIRLVWASHDAVAYLADGTTSEPRPRASCPVAR